MVVPQSDYLRAYFTREDSEGNAHHSIVFELDPGRRNHSLVGARHLRNILSLNVISRDLLLVRFGPSENESYWSFLTP